MKKYGSDEIGGLIKNTLLEQNKTQAQCAIAMCTDKQTMRLIIDGYIMPSQYQVFLFEEYTGVKIEPPKETE